MRIALLGARGFIGKELVQQASREHEVVAPSRPEVDVERPETLVRALKEARPDVVVNLAARIGTILQSVSVREMFATNTIGSLNVAYAAHEAGAKAYVFTSSTVVHGENEVGHHHGRFSSFAPKHPYSASKAAAEFALQKFAKEQSTMSVIVLRPPMVIGAGTPVPLPPIEFTRTVAVGKDIEIFGEGLHEREFVSVRDTAEGILQSARFGMKAGAGYHPFFLTGNRVSMRALAERVVHKFGGQIRYVPKTVQTFSLTTDPSDSERELGWRVRDDLDAILDDVWRFVSLERRAL